MKTASPDPQQLRKFGLLVGGIFAIIGLWPAIVRGQDPRSWALALALALVVPALVLPRTLAPAYRGWMAVGRVLSWVNTRIILGVLFYGLITPMGVAARAFRRDPMRRGFEPNLDTYRVPAQPRPGSHMRRQF